MTENKDIQSGFLLIDKDQGMTSHDVVDALRKITGIKKIGHTGTLDPFATGLLILGITRSATKHMQKLTHQDKRYKATIIIGASSSTLDTESEVIFDINMPIIKTSDIEKTIKKITGKIEQIPPMFSAIKIKGQPLYKLARQGKEIERKPRQIEIFNFTIEKIVRNDKTIEIETQIHCSSGTYIRAIARDLGESLGTTGYLKSLRRTQISSLKVKNAKKISELTKDNWIKNLLSIEDILIDANQIA